jgi:hypothetical protein
MCAGCTTDAGEDLLQVIRFQRATPGERFGTVHAKGFLVHPAKWLVTKVL